MVHRRNQLSDSSFSISFFSRRQYWPLALKISLFQNVFMKSSFLPKYEQKIVRISALCSEGRNIDDFLFVLWEKRWFHKFILKLCIWPLEINYLVCSSFANDLFQAAVVLWFNIIIERNRASMYNKVFLSYIPRYSTRDHWFVYCICN